MDTEVASIEAFWGDPIQKTNHSSSWTSCYCSEPDQSYSLAAHFRAELESQLKVAAHHLVSPSHLQPIPPLQLSHMATIMSLVLPLQHSFITPFLYLSHLSIKYLFVVVALQTAVCHVALFPPRQLCIQIFNARSYWSGSRFLVSEAP